MADTYSTAEVGFLRCDLDTAVNAFLGWQEGIFQPLGWTVSSEAGDLPASEATTKLLPRATAPITRHLFVETGSDWIAYFDNGPNGTDAGSAVPFLSNKLAVVGVRIVSTDRPHAGGAKPSWLSQTSEYPACIFEFFDSSNAASRVMFSANDGGKWKHMSYGQPLRGIEQELALVDKEHPFSDERLRSVLHALGIDAYTKSWYKNRWNLIVKSGEKGPE